MSELFIELLSEEVPYWLQKNILEQFKKKLTEAIIENNLSLNKKINLEANFTHLRLVFSCTDLIKEQKSIIKEIKGPPVNAPENALTGFLNKIGISKEELLKKKINDKDYYFAKKKVIGKKAEDVIKNSLEEIIFSLNWQKSMRWIHENFKWGRPLNNILFYFNNKFVPLDFLEALSINNNSFTISNKKIEKEIKFKNFSEYKKKLSRSKVILEQSNREEKIRNEINAFCKIKKTFFKKEHEKLISLNAGLVEYPDILFGKIDKNYMALPQEILEVVMINDQNFIPLFEKNNKLSSYFVIIVDFVEKKYEKSIVEDNIKVLQARFADATFYWENDLKTKLEQREKLLSSIKFHQKLGSLEDKTKRMEFIASRLANNLKLECNLKNLSKAIKLSKLDLTTGLVREFPELQGVIGGYIAMEQNNDEDICLSLKEQYLPKGPSDLCPKNNLGILLSLSDKIDNLIGFFLINEMPTSSKDPFALRRSALGVLRIIIENNLKIKLDSFFSNDVINKYNLQNENSFNNKNLIIFFQDRFRFFLKSITKRQDIVNAFFIEKSFNSDFLSLYKKFLALNEFVNKGEGKKIIELNKRALNIVTIEGKKMKINDVINKGLLKEKFELILVDSLEKLKNKIDTEQNDFESILNIISNLQKPLNNFFDNVMVNVDDVEIKNNRLSILKNVLNILKTYADFSKIQK